MRLAAAVFLATFTALPASAVIVECDLDQRSSSWGWFAPTVRFQYEAGDDEAVVNDAVVREMHGKPVKAEITDDTHSRTTFVWTVRTTSSDKQFKAESDVAAKTTFSQVKFRLTYFKADGLASASVTSGVQYLNSPTTAGTCRTIN